jgi:hypothetical protein
MVRVEWSGGWVVESEGRFGAGALLCNCWEDRERRPYTEGR